MITGMEGGIPRDLRGRLVGLHRAGAETREFGWLGKRPCLLMLKCAMAENLGWVGLKFCMELMQRVQLQTSPVLSNFGGVKRMNSL